MQETQEMWERQIWSLGWEDLLEEKMATHSSILAWKIPWTEDPGRLQSTGLQRVGHDWATSLHFTSSQVALVVKKKKPTCQYRRHRRGRFDPWVGKIPWRRKWQLTPIFLPGESHGQKSLAGCSPWDCIELDTTEVSKQQQQQQQQQMTE